MTAGRKVLVIGGGGREHALAVRLLASESVGEVVCCPGNAGTSAAPAGFSSKVLRNASGDPVAVARSELPDLVVIGPEQPLCEGLSDEMRALGLSCFGPSKDAAALEGSKATMKAFCKRHGIRVARDVIVERAEDLDAALATFAQPPVVKADGLCAGKGVVVAESHDQARKAAAEMLSGEAFGVAGQTVVLEERIVGEEASLVAICDGERSYVFPGAQDHKRIFDGDRGPNTGGMGAYAPAPVVTDHLLERMRSEVIERALSGMRAEGKPFIGALFAGIIIDESGEPVVLEFNVRFGDPEAQVLTVVTEGDFGEALFKAAQGRLDPEALVPSGDYALCVVLAAEGYPGSPTRGDVVNGIDDAEALEGVRVFHAGTRQRGDATMTSGGRVLGVTARAASLAQAQELAYEAVNKIQFRGCQFRTDIGRRALI